MPTEGRGDIGDASLTQQIEGRIAAGGEVRGSAVRTHLAGVFAQRYVPDIM